MRPLITRLWTEPAAFLGFLGSVAGVLVLVLDLPPEIVAALPVAAGAVTRRLVTPAKPE